MKKIENYLKAVQRLDEANIEYRKHPDNDVIRDGLIQRFEFTFELAWKASKEYLMDQGFSNDLHFPKQVLRAAYENHMIDDEAVWLKMLSSRNSSFAYLMMSRCRCHRKGYCYILPAGAEKIIRLL